MLRPARQRLSSHGRHLIRRRNLSSVTEYSNKVTAWPFALTPQDALIKMGPYASGLCLAQDMLKSLGARLFPGVFRPFQPMQIAPVYFPAWFVDCEMGAEVGAGDEQRTVSIISNNAYMPGCSFEWISKRNFRPLSFWDGPFPQPFTPDMMRQHGKDVTCLPFTVSPLPLFDNLKSLSYSEAKINEDLRFNPSSVDIRLLAAQPVLIPFYLAKYEYHLTEDIPLSFTFLCDASRADGYAHVHVDTTALRVALDKYDPEYKETFSAQWIEALERYILDHPKPAVAGPPRPKNHHFAAPRVFSPLRNPFLGDQLGRWIERLIDSPEAGRFLNNDGMADMSDLRVRPFSEEEGKANRKWMLLTQDTAEMTSLADAISGAGSSNPEVKHTTIVMHNGKISKAPDADLSGDLRNTIASVLAKKRDTQPLWWRTWLDSLEKKTDRDS